MLLILQNTFLKNAIAKSCLKVILFTVIFFCANSAFGQDIIYTFKGTEIKCKVQEIGEDTVSYNEITNAVRLKYIVRKDIIKIKYANGAVDIFNNGGVVPAAAKETIDNNAKPADSAKVNTKTKLTDSVKQPGMVKAADNTKLPENIRPPDIPKPIAAAKEDTIFTTDGKLFRGKVTDIDETNISYNQTGSADIQKVNIKSVSKIKYSNGVVEPYNTRAVKPNIKADVKPVEKADDAGKPKDEMASVLQGWKRKYISSPLEIF